MRNPLKVLAAALALAAASPAAAQYVFKPAWQVEKEKQEEEQEQEQLRRGLQLQRWYNVARVNVGVSMFYSEYYNCYYWYGYFASFVPFKVGAQVDFHLGGMNNISPGFNVLLGTATATVYSGARAQS